MNIVEDIKHYILFLQNSCQLQISLHPKYRNAVFNDHLLPFGQHCNPYCLCLKSNTELWHTCVAKQSKVFRRLENGSFFGMCHAGVYEFVYPYGGRDSIDGFISVSGYKTENDTSLSAIQTISRQFCLSEKDILESYQALKTDIPDKSFVDTLLHPLCHMMEIFHRQYPRTEDSENTFYVQLCHYMDLHHDQKITIDDLCKEFHCSRSTVSHVFKANSGMSISDYINRLRMEDAKALLLHTHLSVTQIAAMTGFSDASYFSNLFKKQVGLSPLQFRKK